MGLVTSIPAKVTEDLGCMISFRGLATSKVVGRDTHLNTSMERCISLRAGGLLMLWRARRRVDTKCRRTGRSASPCWRKLQRGAATPRLMMRAIAQPGAPERM